MATRSRRSAAGSDSLNPAMIHLYDVIRLRRELEQRGLDASGAKSLLADRLEEAVLLERSGRPSYSPSPQIEKPTKRATKRPLEEARDNDTSQSIDPVTSPKAKKLHSVLKADDVSLIEESFSIELANISAIDELQKEADKLFMDSKKLDEKRKLDEQKNEQIIFEKPADLKKEKGVRKKRSASFRLAEEAKSENVETSSELTPKTFSEESQSASSPVETDEVPHVAANEKDSSTTCYEAQPSIKIKISKGQNESKVLSDLSAVNDVQRVRLKKVKKKEKKKSLIAEHLEPQSKIEENSNSKSKISQPIVESSEKPEIKIKFDKPVVNQPHVESQDRPRKRHKTSTERNISPKTDDNVQSEVNALSEKDHTVRPDSTSDATTSVSTEKLKTPILKKKIPLRMQASVDVLDSIFDKQAELLSSKYKSEQERAIERQRLELAKRRQSATVSSTSHPIQGTVEKRRPTVDFVLPPKSKPSRNDDSPSPSHQRSMTLEEKHKLAQLPPPPPPPPTLPPPVTQNTVKIDNFTDDSSSFAENRTSISPLSRSGSRQSSRNSTPTCVLPVSPSTSIEKSLTDESEHSERPSTSSSLNMFPGAGLDPERIKAMASALQAVFARLGQTQPADAETTAQAQQIVQQQVLDEELKKMQVVAATEQPKTSEMEGSLSSDENNSAEEITCESLAVREQNVESGARSESNVPHENEIDHAIQEVIHDLTSRVHEMLCTDRCIENSSASGNEDTEKKPEISEELLRDPRLLLQKATDVLRSLHSQEVAAVAESEQAEKSNQPYEQMPPDREYKDDDEEEKPLPEFHGEPVPDSDDEVIVEGVSKKKLSKLMVQEEEPIPGDEQIEIDFYNADLHVKASETCKGVIDPDNGDGFALMWGGAKATYGIVVSESTHIQPVIFQIKIVENMPIKHLPFEEIDAHDVRVGWSSQSASNILGEAQHSYAFDSLAKKAANNVFSDYGEPCQVGDIISSCFDMKNEKIYYWKNEQFLGAAFSNVRFDEGDAIFPHLCTKNCKLAVNFGNSVSEEWIALNKLEKDGVFDTEDSPTYFSNLELKLLTRGPIPPSSKSDCTVLMMVGLPGVGKTTWVREYLREHPHEQWTLLSPDTILAAMKVNGVARKRVHQGRWDMVMGLIAKAMNRSLHLACRRRRNYIIDQTNVSREARKRKLTQFKDFQRRCVVIMPSEEVMINRQMKQSRVDGVGPIPVEAMLELKAMLSIPNIENEPIEDVFFVEPPLERIGEAIELVQRFNEEARPWSQKRRNRRGDGRSMDHRSGAHYHSNLRTMNELTNASSTGTSQIEQNSPLLSRSNESHYSNSNPMPQLLATTNTRTASCWAERKSTSGAK